MKSTFIKLRNGNIIFVTKTVQPMQIGHGININSPKLKQVNFSLGNIVSDWNTDTSSLEEQLQKSISKKADRSPRECSLIERRVEMIYNALYKLGHDELVLYRSS